MKSTTKQWYQNKIYHAVGLAILICSGSAAFANGSESLGVPSIEIKSGTGITSAGTGLINQPGLIEIDAPGRINQALFYWECQTSLDSTPTDKDIVGDYDISVDGVLVQGELIGGPTLFYGNTYSTTFRADITDLNLVYYGNNNLVIDGLDCSNQANPELAYANNGAGLMLIYDDGSRSEAEIIVKDGNDLAFYRFASPLDTTVAQTFTFKKSDESRIAQLNLFFSSVSGSASGDHGFRPSAIEITVDGITTVHDDLLDSNDKDEWDTIYLEITIPENETTLTVQAISVDNEPLSKPGRPASFAWNAAALSIEKPAEICGRMEGRGKIKGTRATHRFSLSCNANEPNELQVSWIDYNNSHGKYNRYYGQSNSFRLTTLDNAVCSNDPDSKKRWNNSSFDTLYGTGTGRYNGQSGAKVEFTFVDNGNYGRRDIAKITITDNKGNVVLKQSGILKRGNHDAQDCSYYDNCYSSNYPKHNQNYYYNNYYGYYKPRYFRRW